MKIEQPTYQKMGRLIITIWTEALLVFVYEYPYPEWTRASLANYDGWSPICMLTFVPFQQLYQN